MGHRVLSGFHTLGGAYYVTGDVVFGTLGALLGGIARPQDLTAVGCARTCSRLIGGPEGAIAVAET